MADFKPTPRRTLFLILGCLTTGLGILGVFVPGLPATPFLLLSSWLFYRSSPTLHDRLLRSPLGHYIRDYERHRGMNVRAKAWAVCLMAAMVGISAGWILEQTVLRILVAAAGAAGCVTVLFIVPTRNRHTDSNRS